MNVEPYLFFEGRCEEAIGFYTRVLGAEVQMLMRNRDSPEPQPPGLLPPGSGDKVLNASLRIGGTTVMLSDGHCSGAADFRGFALTLGAADATEAARVFEALADGGAIRMPLTPTFFSPSFGRSLKTAIGSSSLALPSLLPSASP